MQKSRIITPISPEDIRRALHAIQIRPKHVLGVALELRSCCLGRPGSALGLECLHELVMALGCVDAIHQVEDCADHQHNDKAVDCSDAQAGDQEHAAEDHAAAHRRNQGHLEVLRCHHLHKNTYLGDRREEPCSNDD